MTSRIRKRSRSRLVPLAAITAALAVGSIASARPGASSALEACLERQDLPRVARVIDPSGHAVYARVLADRDGQPTRFAPIAADSSPLADVLDLAARPTSHAFEISAAERVARICAPIAVSRAQLDAHERVIVAAGLNYAAHAEEAGGGDVFLFPKPSAPTGPYSPVNPPAGVVLLDYEVELAFALLEEIDPTNPPADDDLLAATAFFLSNDVSDREPIIRYKAFSGPGTGFVDGKGQPGFLPTGPWMVRGTELFAALDACGEKGFGLELSVDQGAGAGVRQAATTAAMILDPHELLVRIGDEIRKGGRLSPMPFRRDGAEEFFPLAVAEPGPKLPAGSIVLTGTPEGVAIGQVTPSPMRLTVRGALRLRSPFAQFLAEEKERAAATRGGYLKAGDRVRARIDGLGAQEFSIGVAGAPLIADPCSSPPPDAERTATGH